MSQKAKKRRITSNATNAAFPPPPAAPSPGPARFAPAFAMGTRPWSPAWHAAAVCAGLLVLVFLVFGQTMGYGFINYDDDAYVTGNPIVLKGLSLQGLRWALTYGRVGHWHPLTWAVHMLDCDLFGIWAGGHHLTSIIFHAAAAVLLFLVFFRITGAFWRCAFVIAIWAVHPLRAESVAWIAELKDVLSAFFFALTLAAYVHYVRRPSAARYAMVAVSFGLGLLSKNMLVTLPCVLLLLDYWPLGRMTGVSRFLPLFREKIPLFILSATSCAITFMVPEKLEPGESLPLWLRLENAPIACCTYLRQTLWPTGLAVEYPNPTHAFPVWEVAGAVFLLCLISAAAWRLRMRQPAVLFGWLWFTGMLAPVIGIAQISHYAHADRYTYLPQVGLLIACVWLASAWAGRHGALLGAAAVAVLGACAIAGWHQTAYWQDSLTLWTHTLDCTRDNAIAHLSAGNALDQRGRTQEAIDEFQEALRINPRMADAYCNLGAAFLKQRRVQDAIEQCLQGLRIEPSNPRILFNLGNALFSAGRVDDAISEYRQALSVDPTMADAEGNLGAALVHQGLDGEGIAALEESLRLMPPYSDPAMAARLINRIKMAQAGIRYSPSR